MKENKFNFENKYGEDLYYFHDSWNGNRGFQYTINNNEVDIYAYTIGIGNQFFMLDSGAPNNMAGDSYKKLLIGLFEKINNLTINSNVNSINSQNELVSQNTQTQSVLQVSNNLKNEITNKSEKLCEVGFWLSMVGLLLAFFGFSFGIILYILVFYFAIQGLKTKKRTKAIISIVMSAISTLIVIGWIISANI